MKFLIFLFLALIIQQENGLVLGQPWVPAPGTSPNWMAFHQYFVQYAQTNNDLINVVFYGDSLTQGWDKEIFDREFLKYGPANFGIGGDKTENNLYRMINGELDPLQSKMVVLMIGGNNIGLGHVHDEVVYGVFTILQTLVYFMPETKIILLGTFPNNLGPGIWDKCLAFNEDLKAMANNVNLFYLEIWDEFLENSPGYGYVDLDIFPDGIHLSKRGYEIYAEALRPTFEYVWSVSSKNEK